MANMSNKKTIMPHQAANERNKNFDEVALGYTKEDAMCEAERCINCKHKPCVDGCPVGVDIPAFIQEIKKGEFEKAYQIISFSNSLPAVCGRACPQETQCEKNCVRAIKGESVGIGRLERFAADYHSEQNIKPIIPQKNGKKTAVIGSGPAGLSCAGELIKRGYDVTIFEALHIAGGVLVYGIPEFRLPEAIVQREIDQLKIQGVEIVTNAVVGKLFTVDELFEQGYQAVFVGSGAGLPAFMGIPGETLKGVYSANEFLTRINLMKAYKPDSATPVIKAKRVAVIGGGNVAMDAARCAKRLGADEVYIIYRRSENELPARAEEVEHAKEEGIIFKFLTNPVEILAGEENSLQLKCVEMILGEADQSGRKRPQVKPDSEFFIDTDCVVVAIGTKPNPLIKQTTDGLDTYDWGGIIADENGKTSKKGVFAGGDAVTGAATIILAMGAGKKAAEAMDKFIKNN